MPHVAFLMLAAAIGGLGWWLRTRAATAGAERAQQRVLPLALCRGDGEHVVDHEHPDAQGDEREDRQEDREEAQALLDLGLRLLDDLGGGERLLALGQRCLHSCGELVVGQRAVGMALQVGQRGQHEAVLHGRAVGKGQGVKQRGRGQWGHRQWEIRCRIPKG